MGAQSLLASFCTHESGTRATLSPNLIALGLVMALVSSSADAQVPTVPVERREPVPLTAPGGTPVTVALTRHFEMGDWKTFEATATAVVKQIRVPAITAEDYVILVWVGRGELDEAALFTAVIHPGNDDYVARLPGLVKASEARLFQVFVSDDEDDALASLYMSTREKNPLLEQIPGAVEKILDPMLALLKSRMVARITEGVERKADGWATVSRIDLPFDRASIKVSFKAELPLQPALLAKKSSQLRRELQLGEARYWPKAQKLAEEMDTIVGKYKQQCLAAETDCLNLLDPYFATAVEQSCTTCPDEERDALRGVDQKFRALVNNLDGTEVAGSAELSNVPLTRFSFGLLTGLVVGSSHSSGQRVKVDENVYSLDPLDRQLAMVTFNGAFTPYDADTFKPTGAERLRWFVGAVITPTFGVGGGVSCLVIRGLGINVGYAALGITVPKDDGRVGDTPKNTNDPFKLGWSGSFFVGVSYSFE
jgi:hypothetical protein